MARRLKPKPRGPLQPFVMRESRRVGRVGRAVRLGLLAELPPDPFLVKEWFEPLESGGEARCRLYAASIPIRLPG